MLEKVSQYRKEMDDVGCDTEVKYIDPTYMIRAIKPNANDSPLRDFFKS